MSKKKKRSNRNKKYSGTRRASKNPNKSLEEKREKVVETELETLEATTKESKTEEVQGDQTPSRSQKVNIQSSRRKRSKSSGSSIDDKKGYLILGLLAAMIVLLFASMLTLANRSTGNQSAGGNQTNISSSTNSENEEDQAEAKVVPTNKSAEAKQAVMEADADTMYAYGLYYDYANLSLNQVVEAFLAEQGIDPSQIAFSYKNTKTNEQFSMNDTQPMTAGSTYKLPLNMLVVDEVDKGKFSLTDRFDITNTDYEYQGEHDNYVGAFGGAMTIPEMQEYSLVYSENTPAYALAERLGGMDAFYKMLDKYGESKADIKTIQMEGNKTTTDYYIQVLDYLWKHQDKYKDILYYIGVSFPNLYYKGYLPNDLTIYQKPGYVREALNVDAIVMEETPYLVAIYTRYLGGSTEESSEVNAWGLQQLEMLAYVINEWHRVNMN